MSNNLVRISELEETHVDNKDSSAYKVGSIVLLGDYKWHSSMFMVEYKIERCGKSHTFFYY